MGETERQITNTEYGWLLYYRNTNEELRVENKLLRETIEELFSVMENIDFSVQELFKYDDMHWDKWETVCLKKPVQLKLF